MVLFPQAKSVCLDGLIVGVAEREATDFSKKSNRLLGRGSDTVRSGHTK